MCGGVPISSLYLVCCFTFSNPSMESSALDWPTGWVRGGAGSKRGKIRSATWASNRLPLGFRRQSSNTGLSTSSTEMKCTLNTQTCKRRDEDDKHINKRTKYINKQMQCEQKTIKNRFPQSINSTTNRAEYSRHIQTWRPTITRDASNDHCTGHKLPKYREGTKKRILMYGGSTDTKS